MWSAEERMSRLERLERIERKVERLENFSNPISISSQFKLLSLADIGIGCLNNTRYRHPSTDIQHLDVDNISFIHEFK